MDAPRQSLGSLNLSALSLKQQVLLPERTPNKGKT